MSSAKIVGVYPVSEAEEPCHLVEMEVTDSSGVFAVGDITQEIASEPRDNWQAPYAERLMSVDGSKILTEEFEAEDHPDLWRKDFRLVFFFHHLDLKTPLATPLGKLHLPTPTERPSRLSDLTYEAP